MAIDVLVRQGKVLGTTLVSEHHIFGGWYGTQREDRRLRAVFGHTSRAKHGQTVQLSIVIPCRELMECSIVGIPKIHAILYVHEGCPMLVERLFAKFDEKRQTTEYESLFSDQISTGNGSGGPLCGNLWFPPLQAPVGNKPIFPDRARGNMESALEGSCEGLVIDIPIVLRQMGYGTIGLGNLGGQPGKQPSLDIRFRRHSCYRGE